MSQMSQWPDHYNLHDAPEIESAVKAFIDKHLQSLKELDNARFSWVSENLPAEYEMTYFFYDHTLRVADDMGKTAKHMGFSDTCTEQLTMAMLAHDFGKTRLPVDIWDMMEKPEDEVKNARRRHTALGVEMLREELPFEHPFIELTADIMAHHHEHMDGSGYLGLSAEQLSAPVRLASIIESFDGYSIPRPHFGDRDISVPGVLARMQGEKGEAIYDMSLFEAFAEMKMAEYNQTQN